MRFDEEEIFIGDEDDAASARRTFRREELTTCEGCGRQSPPTRMSCLYCGAALPATKGAEDLRRPALKSLAEGERGFNVVLLPCADLNLRAGALDEVASLVRVKPEQLREMMTAGVPLPLARTGERAEVALLERRLAELGLTIEIVPDDELAIDETRRVRRIEFGADEITAWGGAGVESWSAAWDDLRLLIGGRIYRRRIEVEERVKRGAQGEVTDARELVEDEAVIDLCFAGGPESWRIMSEGFDYSCLGARKSLLASENFVRLVETLRERAPRVVFDDSYKRVRHLLQFAWSPTEHTESGGVRRVTAGKFRTGAVTCVTNEAQFTRYSRLFSRHARRATEHA